MKNYRELAENILKEQGIKIKTEYVNDFKYDDNWIYLPRIYAYDYQKAKVRILRNGIDKVKNCIKITFNQGRVDKQYLEILLQSKIHLIKHNLRGSCQTFLTCGNLAQVLTVLGRNNLPTEEAKQQLSQSKELI